MKNFSIYFEDIDNSETIIYGRIKIFDFNERFESDLSYWSKKKYQQHWNESIVRIINGEDASCLITSMRNPKTANFIFWWLLYRVGEDIFIQNQVLLFDHLKVSFNENNPYIHIEERETVTENGIPISEWKVSIRDLKEFVGF